MSSKEPTATAPESSFGSGMSALLERTKGAGLSKPPIRDTGGKYTRDCLPTAVPPEFQFLNIHDLKRVIKKSASTLYKWMSEGKMPPMEKIGGNPSIMRLSVYQEWAANPLEWNRKTAA